MPLQKYRVTYIEESGKEHTVEVAEGWSLMEGAVKHLIPGIDADCGGACACSTCHVYVVKGFDDTSEIEDEEFDILDKAFDVRPSSRLGCQAKVHGDIEVEISDESFQAFLDEHPDEKERARKLRER